MTGFSSDVFDVTDLCGIDMLGLSGVDLFSVKNLCGVDVTGSCDIGVVDFVSSEICYRIVA